MELDGILGNWLICAAVRLSTLILQQIQNKDNKHTHKLSQVRKILPFQYSCSSKLNMNVEKILSHKFSHFTHFFSLHQTGNCLFAFCKSKTASLWYQFLTDPESNICLLTPFCLRSKIHDRHFKREIPKFGYHHKYIQSHLHYHGP